MVSVLVFSGGIGSERSKLAREVAGRLGWEFTKFSDEIRKRIVNDGEDPEKRSKLQSYGQDLVQNDLPGFVAAVLENAKFADKGFCVVDGLRHIEVLLELEKTLPSGSIGYIHVDPDDTRIEESAQERGIAEQNLFKYNQALSEAQIPRILPAYADLRLDASGGRSMNIIKVLRRFELEQEAPED